MVIINPLFLLYIFLAPIVFFRGFFDAHEFPKLIFFYGIILTILPIFLFSKIKQNQTIIKLGIGDLLILMFGLIAIISTISSTNPWLSFWGFYPKASQSLLFFTFSVIFFFLVRAILVNFSKVEEFLLFGVVGLLVSAVYGIILYIQGAERVSATEAHPIFFGCLMMLGLFLSLAILILNSNKRLFIFPVITFLLGLIISFSRSVWLSLVVSCLLLGLMVFRNSSLRALWQNKNSLTLILVVVVSLVVFSQPIFARLQPLFSTSFNTSQSIRILEMQDGINLAKARSFPLGVGPAHLPIFYPQFRSMQHNQTNEWDQYPTQIRNNYLNILIALGPLALAVFGLILLSVLYSAWQIIIGKQLHPKQQVFYLVIFAGWVGLLVYGVLYFYTVSVWIYFWVLTAILLSNLKPKVIIKIKGSVIILLFFLALILFLIGGRTIWRTIEAEMFFVNGLKFNNQLSYSQLYSLKNQSNILFVDHPFTPQDRQLLESATQQFEQAAKIAPYFNPVYQRQYIHSLALLGRVQDTLDGKKSYYLKAYDQANNYLASYSSDYLNLQLRSQIAFRIGLDGIEKNSYLQIAVKDTQELVHLDPTNPTNLDNLGLIYREMGELSKAKLSFDRAILLKNNYLPNFLHLAEVELLLGNRERAKNLYNRALELSPGNNYIKQKLEELESSF